MVSLATEINFHGGCLDPIGHLIAFVESQTTSFTYPKPSHKTTALLMPKSLASFESLIPIDSEKTKDDPCESRETPPITAGPSFSLETPSTLNFKVLWIGGDHFSFLTSFLFYL